MAWRECCKCTWWLLARIGVLPGLSGSINWQGIGFWCMAWWGVRSTHFWSHEMICRQRARAYHCLALGSPVSWQDGCSSWSGDCVICMFVVLNKKKKKNKQKKMFKKKNKHRGFWFQGPYVDPDADPLGVMIHLPSVEVSYGKTDSALASSSGWCTV